MYSCIGQPTDRSLWMQWNWQVNICLFKIPIFAQSTHLLNSNIHMSTLGMILTVSLSFSLLIFAALGKNDRRMNSVLSSSAFNCYLVYRSRWSDYYIWAIQRYILWRGSEMWVRIFSILLVSGHEIKSSNSIVLVHIRHMTIAESFSGHSFRQREVSSHHIEQFAVPQVTIILSAISTTFHIS